MFFGKASLTYRTFEDCTLIIQKIKCIKLKPVIYINTWKVTTNNRVHSKNMFADHTSNIREWVCLRLDETPSRRSTRIATATMKRILGNPKLGGCSSSCEVSTSVPRYRKTKVNQNTYGATVVNRHRLDLDGKTINFLFK